jgi:hypothetical protein
MLHLYTYIFNLIYFWSHITFLFNGISLPDIHRILLCLDHFGGTGFTFFISSDSLGLWFLLFAVIFYSCTISVVSVIFVMQLREFFSHS